MSIRKLSGSTLAILLVGAAYTLPAAAVTCPPGEEARGVSAQCEKPPMTKPQLDAEKYTGAQKAEAQACNKANAAHAAIVASSDEITRLNTELSAAQHAVQDAAKGAAKDAAKAKVAELKAQRKAEEKKLSQARADESAAKKDQRAVKKQLKKEKQESLNCL